MKETFEHLMTVLMIMLGDAKEAGLFIHSFYEPTEKEWEAGHKKEAKLFKEASKYLQSWIDENYERK